MTRVGLSILGLLLVLAVSACRNEDGEVLRFGLQSAPVTLDPRFATDAASSRINRLLYGRLVDFDEQLRPQASLATWEALSATHYRFQLGRQGREFSDGRRLTAADVVATYRSILAPATGSPHRGSLQHIEVVRELDADSLEFELSRPDPLFPGRLVIGILPAEGIRSGRAFGQQPLGSGGFEMLDWPEEGLLRLRRRRDGQELEFVKVQEPTVRVLKLIRGEIDMLQGDLPPELVAWLDERPGIRLQRGRGSNFAYLGFNMQDPVVGQPDLRRAVASALDRPAMIKYVLGAAARPASALLPPDHWAGNPDLPLTPHDPQQARRFLAGLKRPLREPLVYKTSNNPFRIRLATVIQDQLSRAGIPVRINSYDWGTFYGDIKAGRFQMYSLAWVGIKMPDIFRYVFHSESVPPAGANRGRYLDPEVDRLIDQAEAALQPGEQARLYRELQARILEQLPYVPLWYEDHVFAARDDVAGYALSRDGNYDGLLKVSRR